MAYNYDPQGEFVRLGQTVTSKLVGWFFKGALISLVLLFLVAIVVTVIGLDVFGVARDPLTNRPAGAVAGLPPSSDYLTEIPGEQLTVIRSATSNRNLPWEVVTAIIRLESRFGHKGQNYAGLTAEQWDRFAPQMLTDWQPNTQPDFANAEKSIKILVAVLADMGMRSGDGAAIERAIKAYKPEKGETYFYRVLQVAGRYGFILPGSFEERLVGLAVAQEGKPYIWAATGPNAFDCSGLTLFVHAQLGVGLPRNSEAQYFAAEPVTNDQLMPGDMFFLQNTYSDPSIRVTHVGIYKGGGIVIHAPQEGDVVKEERVDNAFFQEHWYGFARAKRSGMLPPTSGSDPDELGGEPINGDWRSFDVTKGEPKAAAIDSWLANCGGQGVRSPQLDEAPAGETIGQVYLRMGRKYGINPAYAAVFFTKESSCGNFGDNLAAHDYGNLRWFEGCGCPTLDGIWQAFPTWTDGMEAWFRLIKNYYVGRGLLTVDQIIPVYAPSFENNTAQYIQQVKQRVSIIMSQ
ncbi:MAG TPA: NlpC/P60 family protein [Chloroflexia bacterium]|nr:NlpC/P60 family protein [Chloroflexia bacterium]